MYTSNQGRWLSPDPMPGSVLNPQSLNRYAYVLNNPTTLIDPLGLQEPCTVASGCRDPHVVSHEPGLAPSFGNCTLDYVPINCGALLRAIGAGITNVNPIFISGNTITATTVECTWSESTGRVCTSGVATFTLPDLGTALDDAYGKALGTLAQFFTGRPPGQSFGACVDQNVTMMTFGNVDPKKLFSSGLAKIESAAIFLSVASIPVSTPGGTLTVPLGPHVAGRLAQALGLTGLSAAAFMRTVAGGLYSLSVAGAATAGAGIGSSANCAAVGVGGP